MFEWDEEKRAHNLGKHGVDFLDAALIFESNTLTLEDIRTDYGEPRYISIGLVDGITYVVVHTQRGKNIRLISAWKGGRKEHEKYKNSFP